MWLQLCNLCLQVGAAWLRALRNLRDGVSCCILMRCRSLWRQLLAASTGLRGGESCSVLMRHRSLHWRGTHCGSALHRRGTHCGSAMQMVWCPLVYFVPSAVTLLQLCRAGLLTL